MSSPALDVAANVMALPSDAYTPGLMPWIRWNHETIAKMFGILFYIKPCLKYLPMHQNIFADVFTSLCEIKHMAIAKHFLAIIFVSYKGTFLNRVGCTVTLVLQIKN